MQMFLYKITNIVNQKCYVGFTSISIEDRFATHLRNSNYKRCSQKIYNAIRKYGKENFIVEQIYSGEDALEKENYFIKYYCAEYNMAEGGNKPPSQKGRTGKMSEATKEKLRKPKPPRTKEHIEKLRQANIGKIVSRESVEKMLETKRNNPSSFHRPYGNTNRAKTYFVIHPDGKEEIVYNIAEFARNYNLQKSSITLVCQGKRKCTKGFKFEYIN